MGREYRDLRGTGWTYVRDAGDADWSDARTIRHGVRWSVAQEILCSHPPTVSHPVEEHDSGRLPGGSGGIGNSDRQHWKDGEYRHAAGLRDGVRFRLGAALYRTGSASTIPYARDLFWRQIADRSGSWGGIQSDHDDQPG